MEFGPVIVAGFGFRAGATRASIRDALARAAGGRKVAVYATPADKTAALEAMLGEPAVAVPADALAHQTTRTASPMVLARRGTGSVAEAAALAAAGPEGRLLVSRVISADRMATCALAEGPGHRPEAER